MPCGQDGNSDDAPRPLDCAVQWRISLELCVPNIRFSMDAENRRGKFVTQ